MKKSYTCLETASYLLDGVQTPITKDDSVELTAAQYARYTSQFTENDDWKMLFDAQVITTVGGAITGLKTFEGASSADLKKLQVKATVVGVMPAGAMAVLEVFDADGVVVETKYEKFASLSTTNGSVYFTGSYLNDAASYKVTFIAPQASGTAYTLSVEVTETIPEDIENIEVVTSVMASGVNNVQLKALDEDGVIVDDNTMFDVIVCADFIGTPAAASLMSGIAEGTKGKIIEFADDQFVKVACEDGLVDLAMTLANAGTPTATPLVFGDNGDGSIPTEGDTVVFGADTFEFLDDYTSELSDEDYIAVYLSDLTASTKEAVATLFAEVFNDESQYEINAVAGAGTVTFTAKAKFETYNTLATVATITANATGVFADSTFGGGTGASTPGVDPTSFYYLGIKYKDKFFVTKRLPYQA